MASIIWPLFNIKSGKITGIKHWFILFYIAQCTFIESLPTFSLHSAVSFYEPIITISHIQSIWCMCNL